MIKRLIRGGVFAMMSMMLSGCMSQQPIGAPCPNFGRHCSQQPVNSWNPQA